MNKLISKFLIVALFTAGVYFYSYYLNLNYNKEIPKPVITLDENFSLKDLDGNLIKLNDKHGPEEVVVHFWATWCPSCVEEFPALVSYFKRYPNKNIRIYLVAVNEKPTKVQSFISKISLTNDFKVLFDDQSTLLNSLGSLKIPETFIFNNQGMLLKHYEGPQVWDKL